MVEAAKIAYRDYPTVVNEVPESGLTYNNTMADYAKMDSLMQSAQKAIGGSSDSAQLSQSYMWTKVAKGEFDDEYKQLYDNTVVLAVLAQISIDGVKRAYAVNPNDDIKRIRAMSCMKRNKDYPYFMKWTHEVQITKNGKERPRSDIDRDRRRITNRIDEEIICPMNWLQVCLDKIQGADKKNIIPTADFFIKYPGEPAHRRQISKIRQLIEEYDGYTRRMLGFMTDDSSETDAYALLLEKTEEVMNKIGALKISKYTMNRLIGTALGVYTKTIRNKKYADAPKFMRKILRTMHAVNRDGFLENFKKPYIP